jgi:glutathione S-transferase
MLTLYFAPGSSSMAAHIALHEVGAEFEMRPLSFGKREQRQPAYLAINPEGKVPTLVIDGRPLTEVAGILYYLARAYPAASSGPTASRTRRRRSRGCRSSPRRCIPRAAAAPIMLLRSLASRTNDSATEPGC